MEFLRNFWRRIRPSFSLTLVKLSEKPKAQTSSAQKTPPVNALAKTVNGVSWMDSLEKFFSSMFSGLADFRERCSRLRVERIQAKADAKIWKLDAKAKSKKMMAEAKASKWQTIFQTLGKQWRLVLKRRAHYRNQRLARKIVLQRAKTAKWREFGRSVSRIFVALRREVRIGFVWMRKFLKSHPKLLRRFVSKVSWSVSILLATLFLVITFIGITFDLRWVWTIAPLGVILSLAFYPLVSNSGFLVNLARVAVTCITVLWAGSWLIFLVV